MADIRDSVRDAFAKLKGDSISSKKRKKSKISSIVSGDICRTDVDTPELLRCLAKGMKPHKGEMVVCVSAKELRRKEDTLRAAARRLGVDLSIRKKIVLDDIDDAICLALSEEDRDRLLAGA